MIVCICHRISQRDLERHAHGCDDFDELQLHTGVATGCGRCGECARAVFDGVRQQAVNRLHIPVAVRQTAAAA